MNGLRKIAVKKFNSKDEHALAIAHATRKKDTRFFLVEDRSFAKSYCSEYDLKIFCREIFSTSSQTFTGSTR